MITGEGKIGFFQRVALRFGGKREDILVDEAPVESLDWHLRRDVEIFGAYPWSMPVEIIRSGTPQHNEIKQRHPEQFRD